MRTQQASAAKIIPFERTGIVEHCFDKHGSEASAQTFFYDEFKLYQR